MVSSVIIRTCRLVYAIRAWEGQRAASVLKLNCGLSCRRIEGLGDQVPLVKSLILAASDRVFSELFEAIAPCLELSRNIPVTMADRKTRALVLDLKVAGIRVQFPLSHGCSRGASYIVSIQEHTRTPTKLIPVCLIVLVPHEFSVMILGDPMTVNSGQCGISLAVVALWMRAELHLQHLEDVLWQRLLLLCIHLLLINPQGQWAAVLCGTLDTNSTSM